MSVKVHSLSLLVMAKKKYKIRLSGIVNFEGLDGDVFFIIFI